jgi:hypothetical protein
VITVLDCLTKRENESYDDFINRILTNETACYVKLADLGDNLDLTRIKNPTEQDKERINKYNKAAERISDALPLQDGIIDERTISISGCVSIQPFMTHDDS